MIIDFHTHTFPDSLAPRAIPKLSASSGIINCLDGTVSSLQESMKTANVDYSVILPIATKASQTDSLNQNAININETAKETGLISFGSIHPECDNYKEIIDSIKASNIPGIKLHPVFQGMPLDDIKYIRLIDYAASKEIPVIIHAGYDISYNNIDFSSVDRIVNLLKHVDSHNIILAHMGGWIEWDKVEEEIIGRDVYLDNSFTISPFNVISKELKPKDSTAFDVEFPMLAMEQFVRMVKNHGSDKILFGSDSPWTSQLEGISTLKNSGLSSTEINNILGENAKKLLKITD